MYPGCLLALIDARFLDVGRLQHHYRYIANEEEWTRLTLYDRPYIDAYPWRLDSGRCIRICMQNDVSRLSAWTESLPIQVCDRQRPNRLCVSGRKCLHAGWKFFNADRDLAAEAFFLLSRNRDLLG